MRCRSKELEEFRMGERREGSKISRIWHVDSIRTERRKSYLCGSRSCMTAPQKQTQGSTVFPTCKARIPPLSPCRVHAWHCPSAPRMPLDPLRAVGAVQVGAAVGTEVVAGLYVDHRVPAHGALLSLTCSHPPCARIRSILLILAGTVPAAAAVRPCARPRQGCHPGVSRQTR